MRTAWMGRIFVAVVLVGCGGGLGQGQVGASVPAAAPASGALGRRITALVSDPTVARAHWGVMVAAMDGTPLFGMNEGQFFQPASTAKLFTTAAALALLGPERRFTSRIEGPVGGHGESTIVGDLILRGGGDANLSGRTVPYVEPALNLKPAGAVAAPEVDPLRYLEAMTDQVAATGLKRVTGDVVGDDTLFAWEPYPSDWTIEDAMWGYGAPVSALSVNDNQIKVTVTPGLKAGDAAEVMLDPAVLFYAVDAAGLRTGAAKSGSHVGMDRPMGSKVLRVYGTIAVDAAPEVEEVAIEDPAEYAAVALKQMLEHRGIQIEGRARAVHRMPQGTAEFLQETNEALPDLPKTAVLSERVLGTVKGGCFDACPLLVEHTSPKVGEDVGVTNKLSLNLHAELLLRQLGTAFGTDSSSAQGARVVRQFLINAGVDPGDFVFYDGSGLSGHDLVTPRAVARLLSFASGQPWFGVYKASLPVGGVDGSLINRFAEAGANRVAALPSLKGHVFAKTGTLGEARALSGYLECASGRTVVFSIMVTDHAPGMSADRAVMDKIVAAVAAAE